MALTRRVDTAGAGSAIASEANGGRSRETIVVVSGQNLAANAAVGKITASGKYTALDPASILGQEVAAGMLIGKVDASAADAEGVIVIRDAELVNERIDWNTMLAGEITTARAELALLGVIVRDGV